MANFGRQPLVLIVRFHPNPLSRSEKAIGWSLIEGQYMKGRREGFTCLAVIMLKRYGWWWAFIHVKRKDLSYTGFGGWGVKSHGGCWYFTCLPAPDKPISGRKEFIISADAGPRYRNSVGRVLIECDNGTVWWNRRWHSTVKLNDNEPEEKWWVSTSPASPATILQEEERNIYIKWLELK